MKINFHNASFVASYFKAKDVKLEQRPEMIFVGRSNVGKSSMINKFLNRKSLARVSATPGKTIAINFYDIDGKIYLVDLPGYGFAKRAKEERRSWGSLIEEYFNMNRQTRLICLLVDCRHEPSEDDMLMFDYLMQKEILFCVLATKADKLSPTALKKQIESLSETFRLNVIPFSSQTGQGTAELRAIIEDLTKDD